MLWSGLFAGVYSHGCIVITAGPHQQLLPLSNLLYQTNKVSSKYEGIGFCCFISVNESWVLVREKSGNSQGISILLISGNLKIGISLFSW